MNMSQSMSPTKETKLSFDASGGHVTRRSQLGPKAPARETHREYECDDVTKVRQKGYCSSQAAGGYTPIPFASLRAMIDDDHITPTIIRTSVVFCFCFSDFFEALGPPT